MLKHTHNSSSTRRGAILLITLIIIYIMTFMVVQFVATAISQIRLQATLKTRHEFSSVAYSVLEIVNAVIYEHQLLDDGNLFGANQGWRHPLEYAESLDLPEGLQVEVNIVDESAKFSLVNINEDQLRHLFEAMDIDFSDRSILVDSLVDWMDKDDLVGLNGAESDFYEAMDPPVKPANAPLTSYEPLRFIRGFRDLFFDEATAMPNERYYQFVEATSLHHKGAVNINGASPLVKQALALQHTLDVDSFDRALAGSDRVYGTDDDTYFGAPGVELSSVGLGNVPGVTNRVSMLRIEIHVSQGDRNYRISTLTRVGGGSGDSSYDDYEEYEEYEGDDYGDDDPGYDEDYDDYEDYDDGSDASEIVQYPFEILRIVENAEID